MNLLDVRSIVPVAWSDEVDSTTRLAKEHLGSSAAVVSPKAFAARTQTGGVGRQGSHWISLVGNLHLSLALPGYAVPETLRPLLPLLTGVVLAQWCERTYKIAPTLKWPNDLILGSRKIAGILCEGTVQGSAWVGACVSVGLNLLVCPKLLADSSYAAQSLRDATGIEVEPETAAQQICALLMQALTWSSSDVGELYRQYATAPGQLWQETSMQQWWQQREFSKEGFLRISPVNASDEIVEVSSSEHGFVWQGMMRSRHLLADVGNSRLKVASADNDAGDVKFSTTWTLDFDELAVKLPAFLELESNRGNPPLLHVASVNQQGYEALAKVSAACGWTVRRVLTRAVRLQASKYDLTRLGVDRFCLIEAALKRQQRARAKAPFLVVSLGTATTIDAIAPDSEHLGGYIGIGLTTGLSALAQKIPVLPKIVLEKDKFERDKPSPVPQTTNDAMTAAAIRMQVAWITDEIKCLQRRYGTPPKVLLTGGWADSLEACLAGYAPEICEGLVLEGLMELVLAGS